MSRMHLALPSALCCGLLCGAIAQGQDASSQQSTRWTDRFVAEQAAALASPNTAAIVHFRATPCSEAIYANSWLDRFEKRLAGEALEGVGVREAVAAVDVDSQGTVTVHATLAMKDGYRDGSTTEEEILALLRPIGAHAEFGERTIRLSSVPFDEKREHASLDADRIERDLALIDGMPLRIVTVEPRSFEPDKTFVSASRPEVAPVDHDAIAIGFDPAGTSVVVRYARDGESTIALALDEDHEFSPLLRVAACMARSTSDALARIGSPVEQPEETINTTVDFPPFGLPMAAR